MDTGFVDLVGPSTVRDNQVILSASDRLVQTASNAHIERLALYTTGLDFDDSRFPDPEGGSRQFSAARKIEFEVAWGPVYSRPKAKGKEAREF